MKQLLIILLFFSLLFAACSDSDDINDIDPPVSPVGNKFFTGIDLSKSYFLLNSLPTFENEPFHALGYGYDITGKYAHPDGIRNKVVDTRKFENDYYDRIFSMGMFVHRGVGTMTGTKDKIKEQLFEDLKIKTDNISKEYKNAFRGIFDIPFENDTTFVELNYYYAINAFVSSWHEHYFQLFNNKDLLLLRERLTDEFKSDLESKSVNEIINLYGTHVMVDIEVGWRQDYYFRSSSDEELDKRMIYASAKFLSSTPEIWMEPKPETYYDKENLYSEYVSGVDPVNEPVAWLFDITNYSDKLKFENREHAIEKKNLVLVNWGRRSGFGPIIPIYEFVADITKREALLQACQEYLNKQ